MDLVCSNNHLKEGWCRVGVDAWHGLQMPKLSLSTKKKWSDSMLGLKDDCMSYVVCLFFELCSCTLARWLWRREFLFVVRHGVKHNESSVTWRVAAKEKCEFGHGIINLHLKWLFSLFLRSWQPWKFSIFNFTLQSRVFTDCWLLKEIMSKCISLLSQNRPNDIVCTWDISHLLSRRAPVKPVCLFGFICCCWLPTPTRRSRTSHAAVSTGQVVAKQSDGCAPPPPPTPHHSVMSWNQAAWRWMSPIEKRWCVSNYRKWAGSVRGGGCGWGMASCCPRAYRASSPTHSTNPRLAKTATAPTETLSRPVGIKLKTGARPLGFQAENIQNYHLKFILVFRFQGKMRHFFSAGYLLMLHN